MPILIPHFFKVARPAIVTLLLLALLTIFLATGYWGVVAAPSEDAVGELEPSRPIAARPILQSNDLAFPSDDAGFSAYYRLTEEGTFSLDKDKVDKYVFSRVGAGDTTVRTGPATLVDVGDNYTVATLSLANIDTTTSRVNLYYDDEGWIVAYLPRGEPSALIWQARDIDAENPEISDSDLDDNILLDTVNVVVSEALGESTVKHDDDGLGYYHWQYKEADSFLMMVVSTSNAGDSYPVQFAIPSTLTVAEISSSMWIAQGANSQAPCAQVTLDGEDLIDEECTRGIFSSTATLTRGAGTSTHNWTLNQSARDGGGAGSALLVLYSSSGS